MTTFPSRRRFLAQSAAVAGAVVGGGLLGPTEARASSSPALSGPAGAAPRSVSGVYPSLAMFNDEYECGTGALVVWADRLWAITYGPHLPYRSSDKLYEITSDLVQTVRPESVGGTNANRMIHAETQQLLIGPYAIDADRNVRVIPREVMPGRLTGTARHISDPQHKVHYATMEEGLYSVDVHTLEVFGEIKDGNDGGITSPTHPAQISTQLPGAHGKGLYSRPGHLYFSNNGDQSSAAQKDPDATSGALAEWEGSGDWSLIRRNEFTEITSPLGIAGGTADAGTPVWSVGWDKRSIIVMVLQDGTWHSYRLPKASHCYDGAQGWFTEWPRIREIGESDLLMTMHGAFWRFPAGFRPGRTAGIAQRSTYLRVIGDFCQWGDRIVMGSDDTMSSSSANQRSHQGGIVGPGQSQSALWFVEPARLDNLGVPLGRGSVWEDEPVAAGTVSDPFLIAGFQRRGVHLTHSAGRTVTFTMEVDSAGTGQWSTYRTVKVGANGYTWASFPSTLAAEWMRLRVDVDCPTATAAFTLSNRDTRGSRPTAVFDGLAGPGDRAVTGGVVRARGANLRNLALCADRPAAGGTQEPVGYYQLDGQLNLARVDDPDADAYQRTHAGIAPGKFTVDAASVLVIGDDGRRWRLPKGDAAFDTDGPLGPERLDREVSTERDVFNCHGTVYELPAKKAGDFAKMRPIATHGLRIKDFCSYRGMTVLSGVRDDAAASAHIVRSDDGETAVWVGVIDDLWQLGRPRGTGGPWAATAVTAGAPSDPYLMTGFQDMVLRLSHDAAGAVKVAVQVDLTGEGLWRTYRTVTVVSGGTTTFQFPLDFSAYWVRCVADTTCRATAQFSYGRP